MAEDKYLLSQTKSGLKEWIPTTGAGGVMVYPGAGIALSTGAAWGGSITDNSANWNTAYSDRLKWDGGATGLVAATGRTSLGLGTAAVQDVGYFALVGHDHAGTYSPVLVADILDFQTNKYTPYAAQSAGKFDIGTVAPSNTNRLNYDGDLYSHSFYSSYNVESIYNANHKLGFNYGGIYGYDINGVQRIRFSISALNEDNDASVGHVLDTQNELIANGVKLFEIRNSGKNKFHVMNQQSYSQRNIITDYDGNEYHTVVIGDQEWTVENLRTTHTDNGTDIPLITDAGSWAADTAGAYCYYDNDVANIPIYGLLYNWYATGMSGNLVYFKKDGIQDLGWRLSTDNDFNKLIEFLGGTAVAGGRMKEMGLAHWTTPNEGATNSSGFTALPGGLRQSDGTYHSINIYFLGWSQELGMWLCDYNYVWADKDGVGNAKCGLSVRCVRDVSSKVVKTATPAFANPLNLDASVYKNFAPGTITGNTTLYLQNSSDGDSGFIFLTQDGTGHAVDLGAGHVGYPLPICTETANAQTLITWVNVLGTINMHGQFMND